MKLVKIIFVFAIWLCITLASGNIMAASSIDGKIYNLDDTPAGSLQFPGLNNLVPGGNLWVVSGQYIRVSYSSTEVQWAIRIVTKNSINIGGVYPKPLGPGPDGLWEWEKQGVNSYQYVNGVWQTGDDLVSYCGLINSTTKNDPNSRAPLAWQVFRYNDPYYPDGKLHIPPLIPVPPSTVLNDNTVGGGPIDDWAYMGDVSDTGYVLDPLNDYYWVAYGSGGFSLLAQHPVVYKDADGDALPKPGGGDIIVYIGARFGKKAPDGVTDVGLLPIGQYGTRIYLEIIHW